MEDVCAADDVGGVGVGVGQVRVKVRTVAVVGCEVVQLVVTNLDRACQGKRQSQGF